MRRRFNAKHTSFHSAFTRCSPRRLNCRNPSDLLAFTYGYLGDHDLLRVRTDGEKYLLLAALNLAECVAFVGSTTAA